MTVAFVVAGFDYLAIALRGRRESAGLPPDPRLTTLSQTFHRAISEPETREGERRRRSARRSLTTAFWVYLSLHLHRRLPARWDAFVLLGTLVSRTPAR